MSDSLKLYSDLASWWPYFFPPEDHEREAAIYHRLLARAAGVREVLELGSGGGCNASHLKARYRMTLVDQSPQMLEISRKLNPECAHLPGDMRNVRLGRTFDGA